MDFGYHKKCTGCFLVCPLLGEGWLKVQKGYVYVIMFKIALVLVKNVCFDVKKGISRLLHWVAQKHIAFVTPYYLSLNRLNYLHYDNNWICLEYCITLKLLNWAFPFRLDNSWFKPMSKCLGHILATHKSFKLWVWRW